LEACGGGVSAIADALEGGDAIFELTFYRAILGGDDRVRVWNGGGRFGWLAFAAGGEDAPGCGHGQYGDGCFQNSAAAAKPGGVH
jgi:hypothetical protein